MMSEEIVVADVVTTTDPEDFNVFANTEDAGGTGKLRNSVSNCTELSRGREDETGSSIGGAPTNSDLSITSSESDICRICQQGAKETGESLKEAGCTCKGSVRWIHRACLEDWVRAQRSLTCELCNDTFSQISNEDVIGYINTTPPSGNRPAAGQGSREAPLSVCGDNRRVWFVTIMVLLLFATALSVALTVVTKAAYLDTYKRLQADASTKNLEMFKEYRFTYGLTLAVLTFCATMSAGVSFLWAVAECYIWPGELRLLYRWRRLNTGRRTNNNNSDATNTADFSTAATPTGETSV